MNFFKLPLKTKQKYLVRDCSDGSDLSGYYQFKQEWSGATMHDNRDYVYRDWKSGMWITFHKLHFKCSINLDLLETHKSNKMVIIVLF